MYFVSCDLGFVEEVNDVIDLRPFEGAESVSVDHHSNVPSVFGSEEKDSGTRAMSRLSILQQDSTSTDLRR